MTPSADKTSIWFKPVSLDELMHMSSNTLADFLSIEFTEIGDDYLVATMPVVQKVFQPMGLVHGGANVVLAETVGSMAANQVFDREKFYAVGQEINANHLRGITRGTLTAKTTPVHLGRTSQVWEIKIYNDDNKLSCISRLTMAVIARQ